MTDSSEASKDGCEASDDRATEARGWKRCSRARLLLVARALRGSRTLTRK